MGKLENSGYFEDKLLKDTKKNIVKVDPKGKEAKLNYELMKYKDNLSLVKINLETGRSHQIRVQFSSRHYPLYGDHKYNKKYFNDNKENIALIAKELSFYHPTTKELLHFEIDLPKKYPYTLF